MRLDATLTDPAARDAHLAERLRGLYLGPPRRGPLPGGRAAALRRLDEYDAVRYAATRNFLDAPVSRLSPYLRHGMLEITEVRDAIRRRYRGSPERVEEFLRQLAWRDFFEKCLEYHGAALQADLEEAKHPAPRAPGLPADVAAAATGLPCVDGMLRELFADGYLHNHERLWFAAYLCHFRGVHWSAGARLFRQYLLDGDWASNSASWQWVESTFASKPYFMNRENIERYSAGRWCRDCTAACPFDASYEELERRLFRDRPARRPLPVAEAPPPELPPVEPFAGEPAADVVWLHDAALSPTDVALRSQPTAAVVFVFDVAGLAAEPWAFHRLAFVFDGVCELFAAIPNPVKEVWLGDPAGLLAARGRAIHVTAHPAPPTRAAIDRLRRGRPVYEYPRARLTEYAGEPRRFSRYWEKVAPDVLGYRPAAKRKMR